MVQWTIGVFDHNNLRNVFPNDTNLFLAVMGGVPSILFTTEAWAQIEANAAYALQNLFVRAYFNDLNASTPIISRVNGADGNQSVSVPASTTGDFEDSTNSDTLADGDLFNAQITTNGTHGQVMRLSIVSMILENSLDNRTIVGTTGANIVGDDLTRHLPIVGDLLVASANTEVQYLLRVASTFAHFRVFVSANSLSASTTAQVDVNGAAGNQSVSIGATTTGSFEDTTNTDVLAPGDKINYRFITPVSMMTTDEMFLRTVSMEQEAGGSRTTGMGHAVGGTTSNGQIEFGALEGTTFFGPSTTEAEAQQTARHPFNAKNMFVRVDSNGMDASTSIDFRIGGASSNLGVSPAAMTTGDFEDTTDIEAVVATDNINYQIDGTGSTTGTIGYTIIGLEQQHPDDMPWDFNQPEGVQRNVEVLAY